MSKIGSDVRVGDIFEDLDRRARGRRFRVLYLTYGGEAVRVEGILPPKRKREISVKRLLGRGYRQVKVAEPKQVDAAEPTK